MRKVNIFLITGIIALNLFACNYVISQIITRGPNIGEIYFLGPTVTELYDCLHYSTDFGQNVICVDSTRIGQISTISADKYSGVIYSTNYESLYRSDYYGYQNTWNHINGGISYNNCSGVKEGFIYSSMSKYSENYGVDFFNHNTNGFFGNLFETEIDNQENIGYAITKKSGVFDSIYLLISYDNYENLEIQNILNWATFFIKLSRGVEHGELYLYREMPDSPGLEFSGRELLYSNDYGETWILKHTFNCPNLPIEGIEGGRQSGEIYLYVMYIQCPYVNSEDDHNKHVYIYHSLDYGETFSIYHPLSFGNPANYANFEASPLAGNVPLTVQFTDLSIGVSSWEWDFQNDGIIDSYEQNPIYTYEEEGSFTPKLTINNNVYSEYMAFRKDYIIVLPSTLQEIELYLGYQFISSNHTPENPDMLEVLGNNLNYNLDFVRNSQGQMLQNIGGNWVNNIGDWISTEGYLFKMNESDVLIIDGTVVNPQTPIALNIGYQFISYLPNETLDALEAFTGILNDDLEFIRNSEGGVLRKIGPNWVNGIGDCNLGEGFLVKMNGEGVLQYP